MDILGRVAIVTGAGRGLGWAIAERLARDGANLVIAEIDGARAQEKAEAIQQMKREALPIQMDVSRWADVASMVNQTMSQFKRIDILVNNAGILGPYFPVMEYPEEMWDRVIAVHLKGTFLCCKAVLPIMKAQGSGKVVNMASVAGKEGNALMAPYSAAKAGIRLDQDSGERDGSVQRPRKLRFASLDRNGYGQRDDSRAADPFDF